jgi:serine/threonine protein kinase
MLSRTRIPWKDVKFDTSDGNILGKGAYGVVYAGTATEYVKIPGKTTREARDLQLAVKVFNEKNPSPAEQKLFVREVEIGSRAQHPALLAFVSFTFYPYSIAMERGLVSLGEVLTQQGNGLPYSCTAADGTRMEWNDTKRAMAAYGIAVGMCYLHESQVIHRDLKTDNVMLDDRLEIRIGDFGLSKIMGAGEEQVRNAITMTMNVGTPLYMAPELFSEMAKEEELYGFPVDVYAYAMILYELVLLVKPWTSVKGAPPLKFNLVRYLQDGQRPPLTSEVPEAYQNLIEACWLQDWRARPKFRDIVNQIGGDTLAFPETDMEQFEEYQERMLSALNSCGQQV